MSMLTSIEVTPLPGCFDITVDALRLETQKLCSRLGLIKADTFRRAHEDVIVAQLWWESHTDAQAFENADYEAFSRIVQAAAGRRPVLTSFCPLDVGKPSGEVANEQLVRRANDAFTRKDLDGVLECYAADAIQYEPFIRDPIAGQSQLRDYFEGSFKYFPDESIEIQQLISDGPWVVGKWRCRGTHSGDFLNMPATQREFDVPEATIYEIRQGLIQNLWVFVDSGTIARQFGFEFAPMTPRYDETEFTQY